MDFTSSSDDYLHLGIYILCEGNARLSPSGLTGLPSERENSIGAGCYIMWARSRRKSETYASRFAMLSIDLWSVISATCTVYILNVYPLDKDECCLRDSGREKRHRPRNVDVEARHRKLSDGPEG